ALERMAAALAHRGPDDSGIAVEGAVGLVHRRLAIVDPSPAGRQPMSDAGGRWLLTYNGETFNHLALRAELPGVEWRGGSDTETLVEALARWDAGAIERCNGLFAYAALDRERGRLLLVRDRFGVKPLYVARFGGALWFASEVRALLKAGAPRRPRPLVLRHAVHTGWANGRATPVEGIDRVMPGTVVEVDLKTLATRERSWYDPLDSVDLERMERIAHAGRAEAVTAVEDALRASVRRRLMADVPLGTMCSGGIDSSLITALAAEAGTVHAFNARVVDQPEVDEGPWAAAVAAHVGVELHTFEMTGADWRANLIDVVRHIEYPLTHESSVPMASIARLAHSRGIKVLLSGEGADELFGGYSWLHHHDFADFAARGRRVEATARRAYRALQRRGLFASRVIPDPTPGFSPDAERYERDRIARAIAAYAGHGGARGRLEGRLAADLSTYLPHLLNRQDKSTMMHSIETRVPFLDPDVVGLALNLPLEVRLEPERKAPLREIGRRLLPAGVVERPKIGFGFEVPPYLAPAVRPEFMRDGMLREVFAADRGEWERHLPGICSGLRPVTAEIWLRAVLEGQSSDRISQDLWRDG
nr:asparagine synthase (glutamine-hydrolyzing) [Actinomycetota bacterium]